MARPGLWLTLACLVPAALPARSHGQPPANSARALAETIDRHLSAGWAKAGVKPAAAADDAEFLRRAYLDLAGRIPSVTEARHFLDDNKLDKRARLIDRLLAGP